MSEFVNGEQNTAIPEAVEQLPANGISVIVVGSGIGGLSAARELWRIGCDVRVLERRPQETMTGDRFLLGPTGISTLRKFPRLMRDNNALAEFPTIYISKYDGSLIRKYPNREMISEAARAELPPGTAPQETSRPRIYRAMLEQLRRVGVPVEHGKEVTSYFDDPKEGTGVVLKDGTRLNANLVVAADGLQSTSNKLVHGRDIPAKPIGTSAFRASYPPKLAADNELIQKTFPAELEPMMCIFLGGATDTQVYAWRTSFEIGWGALHTDSSHSEESWHSYSSQARIREFLDAHPELPPAIAELFRLTPPGTAIDYQICMREPQRQWTSNQGRVIQVGDSAHVYHPSSGIGATMAMEDAASLASCLLAARFDIPWATRVSNLLRFERTSCLQAFGIYTETYRGKKQNVLGYGRWLVLHDAELYARDRFAEALDHLQNGKPFKNTNIPPGMEYRPWKADTLVAQKEAGEPTVLDGDWS